MSQESICDMTGFTLRRNFCETSEFFSSNRYVCVIPEFCHTGLKIRV